MEEVICLPSDHQSTLNTFGNTPREYKPQVTLNLFPRNWSRYIEARQKEKQLALQLLAEAIRILSVKQYGKGSGRPPYTLSDKLFLCVQKVLRATTYDANEEFIEYAKFKKWIQGKPRPHTIADFMGEGQLTALLEQLVVLTSTPMTIFEKRYAIDSTGISTFNRDKWVKVRLEHKQHRSYRKIHTVVGTRTNIICAAIVTEGTRGDSPMLNPLLDKMSKYFSIKEVSADGAYASRANAQTVADLGAFPYFKLRKDVRALSHGYPAWKAMVHKFWEHPKRYEKLYHFRSNVETTYSMFKRKISSFVRSKNETAQVNEALCIAISHNLFCLVNAIFCDNLTPEFKS